MKRIRHYIHTGEGFARVHEAEKWTVAQKNAGPSNYRDSVHVLECHHSSDVVFVLLKGHAWMMEGVVKDGRVLEILEEPMSRYEVYLIPRGTWHNTWMEPGAMFVIMENIEVSYDNTEVLHFEDTIPRSTGQ